MRTPWHLWVVAIISLIWNLGGVFDYIAVKFGIESYLSQMTESQRGFFTDLPIWYSAAWATGVWFSVIGSVLLLMRSRLAGGAFGLSLIGLVAASVYSFILLDSSPMRDAGTFAMVFTGAIFVVLVLLLIYARAMTRRGVLA